MTPVADSSRARIGLRVLSNPLWRGGVNYIANWTRALSALPSGERPCVYLLPFDQRGMVLAEELSGLVEGIHPFVRASELDLDLVYPATQIFEAPFGAPWAGWIPDWQCQYLPEMFDDLERARRRLQYGILATRAPCLVTSSHMALDDTIRVVGTTVPARVLPFPALLGPLEAGEDGALFDNLRRRHALPSRFFLVANQFWKHKNHAVIIEALAQVGGDDIACVFTGEMSDPRWPDYGEEIKALVAARGISRRVFLLGALERSEQIILMRHAAALVQPSLFEGWSTVVEEARALGRPVVLSDIPVHREQAPPMGRFFAPHDSAALADVLDTVWVDSETTPGLEPHDQNAYVLACARRLVEVACMAREAYSLSVHDPAIILADVLAGLGMPGDETLEGRLAARTLSGARMMFRGRLEAFGRLEARSAEIGVGQLKYIRKHIGDVL